MTSPQFPSNESGNPRGVLNPLPSRLSRVHGYTRITVLCFPPAVRIHVSAQAPGRTPITIPPVQRLTRPRSSSPAVMTMDLPIMEWGPISLTIRSSKCTLHTPASSASMLPLKTK